MVKAIDAEVSVHSGAPLFSPLEQLKNVGLPSLADVSFEKLAPSTKSNFSLSKPSLTPPKAGASTPSPSFNAVIASLITTLDEIHETGKNVHLTQTKDLGRIQKKLEELQCKNIEVMKEAAAKTQSGDVWSMLQEIGSYILSALNAVFGGFLFAQGSVVVGGMMIASGLLAIANFAFSSNGLWTWVADQLAQENKEYAKQLEATLPAIVGLISAALSISGSAQLWQMRDQINFAGQLFTVVQTTLTFVEGVAAVGKGVSDYQVQHSHSKHIEFQKEMSVQEHALEQLMMDMERMMKTLSDCTASATRMVKLATYCYQRVIQS